MFFMGSRKYDYKVTATVDGKPVPVTMLTPEGDFVLMIDIERLERLIKDRLPHVDVRIYGIVNNSKRYHGKNI